MAKAIEGEKLVDRATIFGRASGFESAHYTTPEGVGDAATQIKD
jgi:hypothetical protein